MKNQQKFSMILMLLWMISINATAQPKVILDNYYNNEFNNKTGKPFHYLWTDTAMSGFSQLGDLFKQQGAVINTLKEKPNKQNLQHANVYIIVDPDTKAETANPNYMDTTSAKEIASWVKRGGMLLLLTNNFKNAELDSFNLLANQFGMHFSNETLHKEQSEAGKPRNFNSCASTNLPNYPLFKEVSKIFLKEIAPIDIHPPAKAILTENGKVIMAEAKYCKGYVLAIGDPWLYNEYIDHAILPQDFDNLKAAENLVKWLLRKTKVARKQ
jgi:unsaturated rhamnogalacturonyl hydrolase